jgi:hypothetical protein
MSSECGFIGWSRVHLLAHTGAVDGQARGARKQTLLGGDRVPQVDGCRRLRVSFGRAVGVWDFTDER